MNMQTLIIINSPMLCLVARLSCSADDTEISFDPDDIITHIEQIGMLVMTASQPWDV